MGNTKLNILTLDKEPWLKDIGYRSGDIIQDDDRNKYYDMYKNNIDIIKNTFAKVDVSLTEYQAYICYKDYKLKANELSEKVQNIDIFSKYFDKIDELSKLNDDQIIEAFKSFLPKKKLVHLSNFLISNRYTAQTHMVEREIMIVSKPIKFNELKCGMMIHDVIGQQMMRVMEICDEFVTLAQISETGKTILTQVCKLDFKNSYGNYNKVKV